MPSATLQADAAWPVADLIRWPRQSSAWRQRRRGDARSTTLEAPASRLAITTPAGYQGTRAAMPNATSAEFAALVETHYAGLFRFALSLSRDDASAADLTQQTFLKWARHGDQLRDRSKAKTWLFTTLHREFLAGRRKLREVADEEELESLPAPRVELADHIDAKAAVAALAELDETYRAPVAMFYLEDMSYAEIAASLEIPIGTVMSRLSRGRERLRNLLSPSPHDAA